ncbi:hypothetical protein V497_00734 [Pseudogymnoascus sp. VKM F-4516 (FW-969)]|nr:hypothetical protein V497_00734 [Pseudogymnoascus sp. VKM F-4516 (FW-969)]
MRLVTTIEAFDALEKSKEHPSSDAITFQLSAKEWREKFNAEVAIREALEIEMMGIKGEKAYWPDHFDRAAGIVVSD